MHVKNSNSGNIQATMRWKYKCRIKINFSGLWHRRYNKSIWQYREEIAMTAEEVVNLAFGMSTGRIESEKERKEYVEIS